MQQATIKYYAKSSPADIKVGRLVDRKSAEAWAEKLNIEYPDLHHWVEGQTEGDLEQRQAEQEQAARLPDTNAQYQEEVENMFGEEWDRQHKQYNLHQLRYMLKSSLQREQWYYIWQRAADAEIERLRAELDGKNEEIGRLKFHERAALEATAHQAEEIAQLRAENERLSKESDALFVKVEHLKGQI